MKAMKAMKAMKGGMKRRKAMKVSKIAKGKHAKAVVFAGRKEKTKTGLTKAALTKNKHGRIVSRKASANGRKRYANIKPWTQAVQAARKQLGIHGFAPVGGKSAKGKALYAKAKSIFNGN